MSEAISERRTAGRLRNALRLLSCVVVVLLSVPSAIAARPSGAAPGPRAAAAGAAGELLDPKHTWVFAAGLCEWKDPKMLPFEKNKRLEPALCTAWRAMGVPNEQVVYLQDKQATLTDVRAAFHALLAKTRSDDLLVVYFQGHGGWNKKTDEHFFCVYDGLWRLKSIYEDIEAEFKGTKALLMADCCGSGGLLDAAQKRGTGRVSYACLASAFKNNASTGAWTFTSSLIKGLKGDPIVDTDGDGWIELGEFAKYAEREMAFIESQKSMFLTTGDFKVRLRLSKATGKHDPELGRHVEAKWQDGKFWKAEIIGDSNGKTKVRYVDDNTTALLKKSEFHAYKPKDGFAVGAKVLAKSDSDDGARWRPATVTQNAYGLHEVKFDGDAAPPEWVPKDWIKAR